MTNPVDFVQQLSWQDAACVEQHIKSLQDLGFRLTSECAQVASMQLKALGLLHRDDSHYALIFEDPESGVWAELGIQATRCEIAPNNWGKKTFIASSATTRKEWGSKSTEVVLLSSQPASALMAEVDRLLGDLAVDRQDEFLFGMVLHERLYQKWHYLDESSSPATLAARQAEQKSCLERWTASMVACFRKLGFLKAPGRLSNKALTTMILEYDTPLFERFPGTLAVVDDYDEFADFFSAEERQTMPDTTQLMDLKVLAVLDPGRVFWGWRHWTYSFDAARAEHLLSAQCMLDALIQVSAGHIDPGAAQAIDHDGKVSMVRLTGLDINEEKRVDYEDYFGLEKNGVPLRVPGPAILDAFNTLLKDRGLGFYRFDYPAQAEQSCFDSRYIVLLSDSERELLELKRGWTFQSRA